LGEFPLTVKRQMIEALWKPYPVRMLCALLEVAPSSYYYTRLGRDDLSLLSQIEAVLVQFPTYGYRRVTEQLHREGQAVNHKRVRRVMQENDLLRVVKRGVRTTCSEHPYGRYPNLVRELEVVRPDQVWCADITYIQVQWEFVYLAVILDQFTRGLRGWNLTRTLSSELALGALERALARRVPEIHHSDQGVQYAAVGYVERLQSAGVCISMAAVGQAVENPYAERVIRTIKEEEVYLADYVDLADAYQRIGHFIEEVYQTKRIHSALHYLTPAEFEQAYWAQQQRVPAMAVG
jgi:putative transposase